MAERPRSESDRAIVAFVLLALVVVFVVALIYRINSGDIGFLLFALLFLTLFLGAIQSVLGIKPASVFEPLLLGLAKIVFAYRAPQLLGRSAILDHSDVLDLKPYLVHDARAGRNGSIHQG